MKAIIERVIYNKAVTTKFGTRHEFKLQYDGKTATFLSNSETQDNFIEGKESEFTETEREYNGKVYYNVKPIKNGGGYSGFSKALKKEQSKYSGFAMSYAKDLVVAEKINPDQMFATAKKMMDWMVEQDKALENG